MSLLKRVIILLFIILATSSVTLKAQEEMPLITDRPDITESAVIVPLNTFQIETGFQYHKQKINEDSQQLVHDNLIFASTIFRYGIDYRFELRFGGEYFISKTTTELTEFNNEGLRNLFVGTKLQFFRNEKIINNAAILFEVGLPFGNESLRPDKAEPKILITADRDINELLNIGINIGSQYVSDIRKSNIFYSTSIGIELGNRFGTFVEYFGDSMRGLHPKHHFDFGITYLQKKNIQIDASFGTLLSSMETDWFGSIGFSVRLGQND